MRAVECKFRLAARYGRAGTLAPYLSTSARDIRYRHLSSVLIHIVPWCLYFFLSELLLSFCPALRSLIDSLYHGSRAGSLEERGKHPAKIAIREPSLLGSHLGTNRSQSSFHTAHQPKHTEKAPILRTCRRLLRATLSDQMRIGPSTA